MSLVCMIGTRQPIGVLFPMESHLFCSQLSLVAYSSLCRLRPHKFFPVQFVMSIRAVLYSSCTGCHVEGKMCMSNITRKQNLTAKFLISLPVQSSFLFFFNLPWVSGAQICILIHCAFLCLHISKKQNKIYRVVEKERNDISILLAKNKINSNWNKP